MQNTGKASEKQFDDHWLQYGKRALVYKFEDGAALYGLNKKAVANSKKPCDRIVVHDGRVIFAEVKSTQNETSFPFSIIKPGQIGYAKMIRAAGGTYEFFVHSLALNKWFRIPAGVVLDNDKKSLRWDDLTTLGLEFDI